MMDAHVGASLRFRIKRLFKNHKMNKTKLFITLFSLVIASLGGMAASHRLATFNVRYCATTDKGGKDWCNRGPFAISMITKYDFDVVGFQELTGRGRGNNNSLTGKSQLEEFRASLEGSGYTFLAWDRDGTADKEYVGIAFKNGKYDMLESGSFFISPTPEKYSAGWDKKIATHTRNVGWVKLKDKSTGDIFFYAATHTNNGWTLDGVYGSQLVANRVKEIAGDYPVMVVADYNMQRIPRDVKAYKAYRASFKDAKFEVAAEKNYCLPTTLPGTEGTYGAFNTTSSSYAFKEIDYQFFRHMKILERHIVVDTYDYQGTQYPASDHFPVFVVAELESPAAPREVYVDYEASADGDGTKAKPYNSIADAAANAEIDDIIMVTEGVYNESVAPENTLTILGGYNKAFTEVVGKTVLDGEGLEYPLVYVPENYSLTMKNCELRNYRSTAVERDGALLFRGCDLTLENVDFINNEAVGYGGAVSAISNPDLKPYYADCNNFIATRCSFKGNKAVNGGAIAVGFYDKFRLDGCSFDSNEATSTAGAVYLDCGTPVATEIWFTNATAMISNSSFVENKSRKSGALYINDEMPNVQFTVVNTTFADNTLDSKGGLATVVKACAGAAIHARLSDSAVNEEAKAGTSRLNLGHVTVTGNRATVPASSAGNYYASAINISGGDVRLMNNIIAGNHSDGTEAYADICVEDPDRVLKDANNLYSTATTVSFIPDAKSIMAVDKNAYINAFPALMDGKMENGVFSANIIREAGKTPYARLASTKYGDCDVNTLTVLMRNLEKEFSVDIDGNGVVGNQLKVDQHGNARAGKSVPGAIEYSELTAIGDVFSDVDGSVVLSCVSDGVYRLSSPDVIRNVVVSDLSGRVLKNVGGNGSTEVDIDLSSLSACICLIACGGRTFKVVR